MEPDIVWSAAVVLAGALGYFVGVTWGRWSTWRRLRRPMADLTQIAEDLRREETGE